MVYLRLNDNSPKAHEVLEDLKKMGFIEVLDENMPNETTKQAMAEAEKENLKRYSNIDDLMADLNKD